MSMLNYRHLYYFFVVAKAGGFARAAERLDMAVQTISAQVRALELDLGHQLLKPAGRGVMLTDAGHAVLARAEEIFQLGERIAEEAASAASGIATRLTLGLSDGLSKHAAHALLRPVLNIPRVRLVCHEGEVEDLLADLALHRLDLVLACRAPPTNNNLRLNCERVASSPVDWFGPRSLLGETSSATFPGVLRDLPLLLPTGHAALRERLERWFEAQHIQPHVVGEFEDSALMALFAAQGLGVFPISSLGADNVANLAELRFLGRCDDLHEEIYAIRSQRGLQHPQVKQIISRALNDL
jgi:LysR family transcriptional regulator, transcriptional activator of nhaA